MATISSDSPTRYESVRLIKRNAPERKKNADENQKVAAVC
jgi:hypothetical protein